MLKRSYTWNLKPSGKGMNIEVESHYGILLVMNDRLRFDLMELNDIILKSVMTKYAFNHCKVVLVDLFGRVNVIGL